jgi:hypothetical protein
VKTIIVVLLLAFGVGLRAQTAKVIELTPAEAKEAKALYAEQKAVADKIEKLRASIEKAHLIVVTATTYWDQPTNTLKLQGWYGGFEFSEDFKFIVPVATPASSFNNLCFSTDGMGSTNCGVGTYLTVPTTVTYTHDGR